MKYAALVALCAGLGWAVTAGAQSPPLIDGVGAWTHSQTMRHRPDGESRKPKPEKASEEDGHTRLMALSPAARQALIALKPELDARTERDGVAAANRWFETQVAAAERREGLRR